eukprot:TRINITY_DN10923_c0_g1_i1.p1 TRINITY_DN10923_c0_g1~~TRINITY_DN10923_c0_g1_i1.p1  ORF type:complete len:348 (+),score=136.92 TRINITY_DN10923_c0_g1_i1:160-1203(+)
MGACLSSEDRKRSRQIDKILNQDKKKNQEELKLLLLGPGESGKSTVFKQMKIIQENGGYSEEELLSYKYIVFGNCVAQMKALLNATAKLNVELSATARPAAERLSKVPSTGEFWSGELGADIKQLWADGDVQLVYAQRDKHFQLNDSAAYFFDNLDRFCQAEYVPTLDDVLRARVRSTGIEEAEFKFKEYAIHMIDVGGQRSERRKWIHCFDAVSAVVFCVSLSEYDQTLREDDTQNRMQESLMLFDEMCNSHWFRNTPFILFLNKTDLLREKIQRVDLNVCFPNYTGGPSFENAVNFIKARFVEKVQLPHPFFVHLTCAISTDNMSYVIEKVRETVLHNIIKEVIL